MFLGFIKRFAMPVADVVFATFVATAVLHMAHRADLPNNFLLRYTHESLNSINGVRVSGRDDIEFLFIPLRVGDTVSVGVTSVFGEQTMRIPLASRYTGADVAVFSCIAIFFLVLGLWVHRMRRDDFSAVIFHCSALTVAAATVGSREIIDMQPAFLGYSACVLFFIAYSFVPACFLHFTSIFPRRTPLHAHHVHQIAYGVSTFLAAWQIIIFFRAATADSIELFHQAERSLSIFEIFLLVGLVGGMVSIVVSYIRAQDLAERKKLRWIIYGLAIGTAPFIFLWILPHAMDVAAPIPEWFAIGMLAVIPLTFAVSIVRYHLMDIDLLINRSAVYGIVIGFLLTLYASIIAVLGWFFETMTPMPNSFVSAATAVIIALLIQPIRIRVQRFVDLKFFRVQYDFRTVQKKIFEGIKNSIDVGKLSELIVEEMNTLLPVERIGFFVVRPVGERLRLIAHRNFDVLARLGLGLDSSSLKASLQLPIALPQRIEPGISYEPGDAEMFDRWRIALILPMTSEHRTILGFLVLGNKRSGVRFSAEDIDLLHGITTQCELVLARISLVKELAFTHEETHRLEELDRLKSYFVSSVSHDMKTPLTNIKMFAELLQSHERIPATEKQEYLEIIGGESERLTRLINNVLDFSKIDHGVKEYHFAELDVGRVLTNVVQSFRYPCKMSHCTLISRLTPDVKLLVDADALVEALENLISNALKYSGAEKQITLSMSVDEKEVGIAVTDEGIGISKDDLPHIFDPFFRTEGGKAHAAGGAGLGLAIVNDIVNAHRGRILVESKIGHGTTVTLFFPLKMLNGEGGAT